MRLKFRIVAAVIVAFTVVLVLNPIQFEWDADRVVGKWQYVASEFRAGELGASEVTLRDDGTMDVRFAFQSTLGIKIVEGSGTWRWSKRLRQFDGRFQAEADGDEILVGLIPREGSLHINVYKTGLRVDSPFLPYDETTYRAGVRALQEATTNRIANHRDAVAKSTANMKELIRRLLVAGGPDGRGWRKIRFDGKNFVLSLVALGLLDPSKSEDRALLFSPGDRKKDEATLRDYRAVTLAHLGETIYSHRKLTSYGGRRQSHRLLRLPEGILPSRELLLLDPTFADHGFVLLGWSDGTVERLSVAAGPGGRPAVLKLGELADERPLRVVDV